MLTVGTPGICLLDPDYSGEWRPWEGASFLVEGANDLHERAPRALVLGGEWVVRLLHLDGGEETGQPPHQREKFLILPGVQQLGELLDTGDEVEEVEPLLRLGHSQAHAFSLWRL